MLQISPNVVLELHAVISLTQSLEFKVHIIAEVRPQIFFFLTFMVDDRLVANYRPCIKRTRVSITKV